jgi:REP element-mobilizing transposase RayT
MYFVTICTQERAALFGDIVGADSISARMVLNDAGKMVDDLYQDSISQFSGVASAKHIIMPNHFHGIIAIDRADMESAPTESLSVIIQTFKRNTTIKYINGVKKGQFRPFNKRVWQRNYHDHIIRSESEYLRIWQYIDENPQRWSEDCYYP